MLRIFRGERRAEAAAQPGQPTQEDDAQVGQAPATTDAAKPPQAPGQQPQAATPSDAPVAAGEAPGESASLAATPAQSEDPPSPSPGGEQPGFLERGRIRRRARFLRAARELAYRDLGGLVFDLHRFGQRNDEVVRAKLDTLSRIDSELRSLEAALSERRSVTVLRQAGVAACPRCAAIHGSGDRFCPTCGLAVNQAERPIATPNAPAPIAPQPAVWPAPGAGLPTAPPARVSSPQHPQPPPQRPAPSEPYRAPAGGPPPIPKPPSPAQTEPAPTGAGSAPAAEPAAAADETQESQTEVIRSGRRRPRASQPTIAFDPISPAAAQPQDRGGEQRGRDQGRS